MAMQKLKLVKSEFIFPVIKDILDKGTSTRITVTGMSMYPFLRENIDSVELSKVDFSDIRRGDIVMVLRDTNEYVMHRVIKVEENWLYIVGDAQQFIEGPLRSNQIVAKITAVWRKDKKIDSLNLWWNLLSKMWMMLLHFRVFIIKSYGTLRRLIR
jgi:signal peptidase